VNPSRSPIGRQITTSPTAGAFGPLPPTRTAVKRAPDPVTVAVAPGSSAKSTSTRSRRYTTWPSSVDDGMSPPSTIRP
jgi:hypothetical protein